MAQKALGNSALHFNIDKTQDNSWGVTYLYGCTALLISHPDYVIGMYASPEHQLPCNPTNSWACPPLLTRSLVAHMLQEVAGKREACINDKDTLNNWLNKKLLPALDLVSSLTISSTRNTRTNVDGYRTGGR